MARVSDSATIVIDTSAVLAVLLNEPNRAAILRASTDKELLAPPTLPWEIANALSAMFKRRVLSPEQAEIVIASFEKIPVLLTPISLSQAVAIAGKFGIYSYDACMIACAQTNGCPLLTLDGGLKEAAKGAGVEVLEVS